MLDRLIKFVVFAGFIGGLESIIVETPLGRVEGEIRKTVNNREYYAFEGIPYAKPPVGKYRFREPIPPEPWTGIWKANTTHRCLQYNQVMPPVEDSVIGQEDCLYVNVYTPNPDPSKRYDVIVYFHGGVFMFTYCQKGPDMLLDRDVVFVNLEYRVGPLGFLSTEDDVVPGNNGLKDQIAALKWVKQNIRYFGGNPDSVTITGLSAGGASVQFHCLMPQSKGLFHKGFSQSGSSTNCWVLTEKPAEKAKKLASIVGCAIDDTQAMIECMRRRPGKEIVQAVKKFTVWLHNPVAPFGAVVDTWASEPLLPGHPYKLLKDRKVADVPWISSHTKTEGLFPASGFYKEEYLREIDQRWNELMPFILDYMDTVDPKLQDMVSEKIRHHYMGDKPLNMETFGQLLELLGDRLFVADIDMATRLHAAAKKTPSYAYIFNYRGAHSISEINSKSLDDVGVSHGDDTSYVLNTGINALSTEEDKKMSNTLLDLITSFAKTGKPQLPIDWVPLSQDPSNPFRYLSIQSPETFKMEEREALGNRQFWDSLPIEENAKLFTSSEKEEL